MRQAVDDDDCMVTLGAAGSAAAEGSTHHPRLIVTKFHADACASCTLLDRYLPGIKESVAEAPVLFVELDFSTPVTTHHSMMLASQLGLMDAVTANRGTGFLLVSDPDGTVLAKLTKKHSVEEMKAALENHLQQGTGAG